MPPDAPPETATPTSETQLAQVLADANRRGLKVVPLGGGTKADWGNVPERTDLVLSTLGLNRVLEHAAGDMTVTVEAGCTISSLQQAVAQRGQRLALDPLWPDRATVGGVLATNDSGALRVGFGSLRDLLLGVTVTLPDGTLARSGGKVVKNVAGYDLPKLMVGAYGTLGVVSRATFRLHPLPQASRALAWQSGEYEPATRFLMTVLAGNVPVAGLDLTAGSAEPVTVIALLEGSPKGLEPAAHRIGELAASCGMSDTGARSDRARDRLLEDVGCAAACKITLLPGQFLELLWLLKYFVPGGQGWSLCVSAAGAGFLRLAAPNVPDLVATVQRIRRKLQLLGGSLSVLRSPEEVKRQAGAWHHDVTNSLPLMMRIKQNFDAANTLNPGRFVGGI